VWQPQDQYRSVALLKATIMDELNTAALGLAVRSARERLKITANDLATQTGMTPSSLSRSEKGTRMLMLDEARSIAHVLGMTVQDLMDLAVQLEQSGLVKKRDEAVQDFQRALDGARAAAHSALESFKSTEE
jgi:transcriptional regulator with XRE-family HTH domain